MLIEGLKELQMTENEEEDFMSDEYKAILINADEIKKMYTL